MYRSLPYGRMSVACRWPGGDISVYISVVYHKDATVSSPKHMLLCYQDSFGTFSEVFATSSERVDFIMMAITNSFNKLH